jgi:hypothetical protein
LGVFLAVFVSFLGLFFAGLTGDFQAFFTRNSRKNHATAFWLKRLLHGG